MDIETWKMEMVVSVWVTSTWERACERGDGSKVVMKTENDLGTYKEHSNVWISMVQSWKQGVFISVHRVTTW